MKLPDALVRLGYATGEEVVRGDGRAARPGLRQSDRGGHPPVGRRTGARVGRPRKRHSAPGRRGWRPDGHRQRPRRFRDLREAPVHPQPPDRDRPGPARAILEAINRHYGQTVGESADSMLQEFTDTAIDFTETEDDGGRRRGGGRREQRPDRPAGPSDHHRGGATSGVGHPHRAVRGPRFASATGSTASWSSATAPPDGCSAPSSPASRFSPNSTSPNAAEPRTAASRSPWARRNSTFG